jgi:hypothetical protein
MKSKVKRYNGAEEESEVYYDKDEDSAAQEVTSSTKNQQEPSPSKVSNAPIATALRKAKAKAEPAPAPEKEASSEKETPKIGTGRFASLSNKVETKPAPKTETKSDKKPIIETEGPGADRRRAIGEGLKSAAKSVGDYFSSLKSPSRMRDEARQKSKTTNMKSGGKVSSASNRADGCAVRGKTRGKMV